MISPLARSHLGPPTPVQGARAPGYPNIARDNAGAFAPSVRRHSQSVADFEARPLRSTADDYDLVVLDHPGLGEAVTDRWLRALDKVVPAEASSTLCRWWSANRLRATISAITSGPSRWMPRPRFLWRSPNLVKGSAGRLGSRASPRLGGADSAMPWAHTRC